ncbi:uncharacterized protein LOC109530551 [Hippocampus comes]|uniref:uncharacterized protein LOC109530551 n=1 Tax=Hippocampus comes TaxID=109280 RepID=UPI00094F0E95|nr:PREDICTED: uncharacterized protein LOC109530551 [Hippocampus comes]
MKLEDQLQASNVTGVWRGLKTISGHNSPKTLTEKDKDWADELNLFFNRFDQTSVRSPNHQLHPLSLRTSPPPPLSTSSQQPSLSPCYCLSVTTEQVRNQLRKMNVRKAAGPDKIRSRLLRTCSDQLCDIVQHMLNLSLKLGRAPQLWKTSCLVPVPRNPHPQELNSYRPVALMSHLMKTLEKTRPCLPSTAGELGTGLAAVCLSAWHRRGGRHHLPPPLSAVTPGGDWEHC